MAKIIKCDLHDHFEIACMRKSKLTLELSNGETVSGIAIDLEVKKGIENLILKVGDGQHKINLVDIDVLVLSETGERHIIS